MFLDDLVAGFDGEALGGQAIGFAHVGGGAFDGVAGGEEDGLGDAHVALVLEKRFVGAFGVVGVLVDVDDWFGGGVGGAVLSGAFWMLSGEGSVLTAGG